MVKFFCENRGLNHERRISSSFDALDLHFVVASHFLVTYHKPPINHIDEPFTRKLSLIRKLHKNIEEDFLFK